MRIAIVDDLETERAQLKTRLARQLRLCGAEAELLEFESGESFFGIQMFGRAWRGYESRAERTGY